MRIIDEITQTEIFDPDLLIGELQEAYWAPPEAYDSIDNITKYAISDDDYEHVYIYHKFDELELADRHIGQELMEHQEIIDSLPDAIADLSEAVSDNTINTEDIMDAIAELSELVSQLIEGE